MVRIGESARQDNNNMKRIAVVGLIYVPGTFVSGLFGMNFFQFVDQGGRQTWKTSDKFWMYWAITLPLTLATISIWVLAFHKTEFKAIMTRIWTPIVALRRREGCKDEGDSA